MQPIFDKLYNQSKNGKTFRNLLEIISAKNNILLAYRNLKGNKGSKTSGYDKFSIKNINKIDTKNLTEKIQKMLKNYQPQIVKRVEIPKNDSSGRFRPLGIPTIMDRLVQQCILQVLEPVCEAKFSDNSYGFRPNRSQENAIQKAMFCMQKKHMHYCVDIDIKGFFDNVSHTKLLKQMWTLGLQDKSLLCIISKILKSDVLLPSGEIIKSHKGTPQGGIISPLLSNIVLNELDRWIDNQWATKDLKEVTPQIRPGGYRSRGHEYRRMRNNTKLKAMQIVRFADDFKIFTYDYKTAKKIFEAVKQWLKDRLDLEISPEKSTITNLKKNYTIFLGFKLKVHEKGKKQVVKSHVSDKAKQAVIKNIVSQVKKAQHSKNKQKELWLLNSKIIGIHNYYRIATNCSKDFGEIAFIVSRAIKHRLKPKRTGTAKGYIKERYGISSQIRFVNGEAIVPIGYIQHKNPMDKKRIINNYTIEGRKEIHKNLTGIDISVLHYLMENHTLGENTEFYSNKIALYSGQLGKCFVTGEPLQIGKIHCHHKLPKQLKKDDSYGNLVLVTDDIHTLLHSTKTETITKYLNFINPNKNQMSKLNKLRKLINLPSL